MKPRSRTVSLSFEIQEIEAAVAGAGLLAEAIVYQQLPDESAVRLAPRAVAGILSLVTTRLHHLGRVLRGEIDPAQIWAPHNAARVDAAGEGHDVVLVEWPPDQPGRRRKQKPAR